MDDRLTENKRIIAVGDIHGCLHTLQRLLELINLQPSDQLVFLGDYIDRGNNSKGVIEFLMTLRERYSCFFLMGNHERMFLDSLDNGASPLWLQNGGAAMLESYGCKNGFDIPEKHREFINSCLYHLETENFFFAHGGIDPDMSIADNLHYMKPEDYCWMRTHLRSTYLENNRYSWKKTLVCGHTPMSRPIMLEKLIAIDTGCVYSDTPDLGMLSSVILPERTVIQTENIDS